MCSWRSAGWVPPGRATAGTVVRTPCTTMDVFPTLVKISGAQPSVPLRDGVAIDSILTTPGSDLERDTLYWHLPHYHHSSPASAIRRGQWKLIEFFESQTVELYDLESDLSERHDLAARHPEKANELKAALAEWRRSVHAQMPVPNPRHDPQKADQLAGKNR